MEERIRNAVGDALAQAGARNIAFVIECPSDSVYGDYATNAALAAAKALGKNPSELADELAHSLVDSLGKDIASHVVVAGPGFVNITLTRGAVTLVVAEAGAQGARWGRGVAKNGKRVIVEYSNPNTFKEMHIGHLVGTVVGETVARLIENSGATVARDTFGGDIGPNVAKAIWGLRKNNTSESMTVSEIGEAYVTGSSAYETSPEAKEEIDALNRALYAGTDRELMELLRKGRDTSMEEFRRIWKLLGTHFDFEFFDSDTTAIGVRVVRDSLAKGIFEMSDGAIIYNGEGKGVHTMVFITSHGTPTYEAKDIGLAFLKEERWPSDNVIVVTGNEQTGRFKTVLAVFGEIAPRVAAKTTHLATGFLKLTSGKMSSREGNVITASSFIQDIIRKAGEKNADPLIAEQIAIGAIKYMLLRQAPGSDILFDTEKSLSLDGDSGPYLQYALVRAKSVLAQTGSGAPTAGVPEIPYLLERIILHFPEITARAARELAPNVLVTYLTELAGEWNSFYAKERIISGDFEVHKRMVAHAFVQTMTNGLALLGIPIPERM
ncbi:MAG TPA: arginine--tRNA ligase [Candidatus Paceibacterota bacterium]|nr:arginine--tRNA ligase [Candidatus Paceibacterota bacterium]